MTLSEDRRAALLAAAAAGSLDQDEARELDAARASDPSIDAELEELRTTLDRVRAVVPTWQEADAEPLRARILAALEDEPLAQREDPRSLPAIARPARQRSSARRWAAPLLAAACLAVGIGVGATVPAVLSAPPTGPAGTLGAVEEIEVRDALPDATIDAQIVAHTWGTEAILEARGLEEGAAYAIVLVGVDGIEHSAGAMLGSAVDIRCIVNAAVLREDVARLEIRDADARVVATADLPRI